MIKIICVGKMKKELQIIASDYLKRVNKYHKIEISETMETDLKSEKDLILKKIKTTDNVIILSIEGKTYSSTQFSRLIEQELATYANITFIIGGSFGLHQDLKKYKQISFSKMTFPHQLFRILLLEQIYRSFKILNNESYHK